MLFRRLDLRGLDVVERVYEKIVYLQTLGWTRDPKADHTLMFSPEGDIAFDMRTEEVFRP